MRGQRRVPLWNVGGAVGEVVYWITATEGNDNLWIDGLLSVTGVKYDGATSITTLPAVDPGSISITTFAVGLGRGVPLHALGTRAYIALRPNPGTGVVTGLINNVPDGSLVIAATKLQLPLFGDPLTLIDCYVPFRLG